MEYNSLLKDINTKMINETNNTVSKTNSFITSNNKSSNDKILNMIALQIQRQGGN